MNYTYFLYIVLILFVVSCSTNKPYIDISKPPDTKRTTVPKSTKKEIPGSYVVYGVRYYPLPDSHGFIQTGKASWYGKKFHGRLTANGEIYDMYKRSAAHKTLPLGTYVNVLNLSNNKQIVLRINDRGPFVRGRIIDLSYAAAKDLSLVGPGVADVKVTALGKEIVKSKSDSNAGPFVELKDLEKGSFTIQIGAFSDKENALKLVDRLKVLFDYINIVKYTDGDKRVLFRVHVSKSKTLSSAGKAEERLKEMGFTEAFIVRI